MVACLLANIYLLLGLAWSAIAAVTVSRTLDIDGQAYYLPREPIVQFPNALDASEILPLTVISTNASGITGDALERIIESWEILDDVFDKLFLQGTSYLACCVACCFNVLPRLE